MFYKVLTVVISCIHTHTHTQILSYLILNDGEGGKARDNKRRGSRWEGEKWAKTVSELQSQCFYHVKHLGYTLSSRLSKPLPLEYSSS